MAMVCMNRDVLFSLNVLVAVIHTRDNDKTLLFKLNVILFGVVQCGRRETDRLIAL